MAGAADRTRSRRWRVISAPKIIFFRQVISTFPVFQELFEDLAGDDPAMVISDLPAHVLRQTHYVQAPGYDRASGRSRVVSWIKYMLHAFRASFAARGRPLLFIVAHPPLMSLLGYLQYKLRGRDYVLWIDDVWPDVIPALGVRSASSWVVRVWAAFNRITYRHAAHVITLGPYMRRKVQPYVAPGTPISIVHTWTDTQRIRPIPKQENPFAVEYGQIGKTTILYSGNMGKTHDMRNLLEAARLLRGREEMHFLFIGAGDQFASVQSSVKLEQDRNITVLPLQPREMLPFSLAAADIALVCLERGVEGISMPSKTYTSLAAGSAILGVCSRESDLAALIDDSACGRHVEPQDPAGIAAALTAMVDDPGELARMRANARSAAEERFSRQQGVAMVRDILEVIERKRAGSG